MQIVPWLNYSVPGVLNLALLTLTTGMGMYCYLLCVISDPGFVTAYQHTVVSTQIEVRPCQIRAVLFSSSAVYQCCKVFDLMCTAAGPG